MWIELHGTLKKSGRSTFRKHISVEGYSDSAHEKADERVREILDGGAYIAAASLFSNGTGSLWRLGEEKQILEWQFVKGKGNQRVAENSHGRASLYPIVFPGDVQTYYAGEILARKVLQRDANRYGYAALFDGQGLVAVWEKRRDGVPVILTKRARFPFDR